MNALFNALVFYAVWFSAVWLAGTGQPLPALSICLGAVAFHLAVTSPSPRWREMMVVGLSALMGLGLETAFIAGGLTAFPMPASGALGPTNIPGWTGGLLAWAPPVWLIGLWAAFGTLLNVSLAPLKKRPGLAAGLAALGGPASYYAGERLGAITLAEPRMLTLAILGAAWVIVFPLLLRASSWLGESAAGGPPDHTSSPT